MNNNGEPARIVRVHSPTRDQNEETDGQFEAEEQGNQGEGEGGEIPQELQRPETDAGDQEMQEAEAENDAREEDEDPDDNFRNLGLLIDQELDDSYKCVLDSLKKNGSRPNSLIEYQPRLPMTFGTLSTHTFRSYWNLKREKELQIQSRNSFISEDSCTRNTVLMSKCSSVSRKGVMVQSLRLPLVQHPSKPIS